MRSQRFGDAHWFSRFRFVSSANVDFCDSQVVFYPHQYSCEFVFCNKVQPLDSPKDDLQRHIKSRFQMEQLIGRSNLARREPSIETKFL